MELGFSRGFNFKLNPLPQAWEGKKKMDDINALGTT